MKRYGLIGYPLGHSFSARYFADKFAREGIADCRYDLYELKTIEELPALLEAQPELRGFNVTIPYKQQIIPYLDDLSPETRMIGAVNCVRCEGRRLTGYNTDVTGLRASSKHFSAGSVPNGHWYWARAGRRKPCNMYWHRWKFRSIWYRGIRQREIIRTTKYRMK